MIARRPFVAACSCCRRDRVRALVMNDRGQPVGAACPLCDGVEPVEPNPATGSARLRTTRTPLVSAPVVPKATP